MKKLSRLVSNKRGTNPGGGAVRVSPGVYRQAAPQQQTPARPQTDSPMPMPQAFDPNQFPKFGPMPQQPQPMGYGMRDPYAAQPQQGGGYAVGMGKQQMGYGGKPTPEMMQQYGQAQGFSPEESQTYKQVQSGQQPISAMQGFWQKRKPLGRLV